MNMLKKVSENYDLMGTIVDYTQCINGHINDTYHIKVKSESGKCEEYIFQRINGYVFKEPIKIMSNIKEISLHVQPKITKCDCDIIHFLDNKDGKNYTCYEDGFWRICRYVNNSVTYETAEDRKVLRSEGYAFGRFQCLLSDLPMDKLHDTIPNFHNTKKRLNDFFETVALDPIGRAKDVEADIRFFENNR
ncbi:MAG TPA: hypothetical protein PK733_14550 [Clostridiales bacterium]|nr:hypothetical protein [Clostridiales bacterium]